jgi:hypothetical protein
LVGSITGSVGLFARLALREQMKSNASVHSEPAFFLAVSRSCRTSGESGLAFSCADRSGCTKDMTNKDARMRAALSMAFSLIEARVA